MRAVLDQSNSDLYPVPWWPQPMFVRIRCSTAQADIPLEQPTQIEWQLFLQMWLKLCRVHAKYRASYSTPCWRATVWGTAAMYLMHFLLCWISVLVSCRMAIRSASYTIPSSSKCAQLRWPKMAMTSRPVLRKETKSIMDLRISWIFNGHTDPSPWYWRFNFVVFGFTAAQWWIDVIALFLTDQRLFAGRILYQPNPKNNPHTAERSHHIENRLPTVVSSKYTGWQHWQHGAQRSSRVTGSESSLIKCTRSTADKNE